MAQGIPEFYEAFGEKRSALGWKKTGVMACSRRQFMKRIAAGWSVEDALTTPPATVGSKTGRKGNLIFAFNEWKSPYAWSQDPRCVPSRTMLRNRLAAGWDPEEAMVTPGTMEPDFSLRELWGEEKRLIDWWRDPRQTAGVSYQTIHTRMRHGMSLEDALTRTYLELRDENAAKYWAFDRWWTLTGLLAIPGCVPDNVGTLHSRIHKLGMSVEEAVTARLDHKSSIGEDQIAVFIQSLGFDVVRSDQSVLGRKHLDIYVPAKNFAVEFNGVWTHCEIYRGRWYHHEKWKGCHDKNVRLLQIWSDTWRMKRPIVELMLKHKLGVADLPRVHARDCGVVWDSWDADDFLDEFHIQGKVNSSVTVGLEHHKQLVAVASFLRQPHGWELSRYATSCRVPGGFSKIIHAFRGSYSGPIKTFADLSFSDGALYEKTGFVYDGFVKPDYMYLTGEVRQHKFGYRKDRFEKDPNLQFDPKMTESELARLNKLYRCWDAGKLRYILCD